MSKRSRRFFLCHVFSIGSRQPFAVTRSGDPKRWCVHREHRDHAAKKYQRENGQGDKYCSAKRVLLFFLVGNGGAFVKWAAALNSADFAVIFSG